MDLKLAAVADSQTAFAWAELQGRIARELHPQDGTGAAVRGWGAKFQTQRRRRCGLAIGGQRQWRGQSPWLVHHGRARCQRQAQLHRGQGGRCAQACRVRRRQAGLWQPSHSDTSRAKAAHRRGDVCPDTAAVGNGHAPAQSARQARPGAIGKAAVRVWAGAVMACGRRRHRCLKPMPPRCSATAPAGRAGVSTQGHWRCRTACRTHPRTQRPLRARRRRRTGRSRAPHMCIGRKVAMTGKTTRITSRRMSVSTNGITP